jgi:predicted ester cyclase
VLEREAPLPARGPGRPKLGVTPREVTLVPRHWRWLERQPGGVSAALRRLVEQASKDPSERARAVRAALGSMLTSLAGDRPGFEEVTRALFAGDVGRLEALVRRWPRDLRELAVRRAREAAHLEGPADPRAVVTELHEAVWSRGEYDAIERLVAPRYVIHSDPGDEWEGQTLDRRGYEARVRASRAAFPDLVFTVQELIAAADRVAVRWCAEGTHAGDTGTLRATGKRLRFCGQTFYAIEGGKVAGHWQVVDRLGFVEQVQRATRDR